MHPSKSLLESFPETKPEYREDGVGSEGRAIEIRKKKKIRKEKNEPSMDEYMIRIRTLVHLEIEIDSKNLLLSKQNKKDYY